MATNTEILGLKKPSKEDFYNVEDFNENFQKIDDFANRKDNPHEVTAEQVGLSVEDISESFIETFYDTVTVDVKRVYKQGNVISGEIKVTLTEDYSGGSLFRTYDEYTPKHNVVASAIGTNVDGNITTDHIISVSFGTRSWNIGLYDHKVSELRFSFSYICK